MDPISGVKFIQGDITKKEIQEEISKSFDFKKADVICSDAVPDFVGEKYIDHIGACALNLDVINFCKIGLKVGGNAIIKIIQGPETDDILD